MTATYIHSRKKMRKTKLVLRSLAVFYFILVGLAVAYVWAMTQNRFISTASFKISRQDSAGVEAGLAQLVIPGISDSSMTDSLVAIGFIDSSDLLLDIESKYSLVSHYSAPSRDFIFRMESDATLEDRLEYYRSRIKAHFDKETGLTNVTVDTFDPKLSQQIAVDLLKRSEDFVNHLNQEIARQRLDFIHGEVDRAVKTVDDINAEILELQNKHNVISPGETITENMRLIHELRMERLRMVAEADSLERDSPNSPRSENLHSRIRSLNELIDIEAAKLSGPEQNRLNQVLSQFKQLELKLEFALKLRTGTESLLEKSRVETLARSRFFSVVQRPFLPEDIAIPQRPYTTATIIVLGILLFLILRALILSMIERAP